MPEVERSFLKDLKNMDRRLGIKFNDRNFVITYARPYGDPVNIYLVRDQNGGFRQPDQRDLIQIRAGDMESQRLKDKLDKVARHCEDVRRKQRQNDKDEIKAMTRDSKIQLQNAVLKKANARKANSTFRRVDLKRKGRTVQEIQAGV